MKMKIRTIAEEENLFIDSCSVLAQIVFLQGPLITTNLLILPRLAILEGSTGGP
jgi:hypothetical protein